MFKKSERDQYNRDRARVCQRLGIDQNQYNWFRRHGQALRNLYTDRCNYGESVPNTDSTNAEYSVIDARAKKLGLFVFYQTDPRGATLYVDTKPIGDDYIQAPCIY